MASNAQKTPIARTLQMFAERKVSDAIQLLGKSLPAKVEALVGSTNAIVTVSFQVNASPFTLPQITVPVWGWQWARAPIQRGDLGKVSPADVAIGNISGLGSGVPDLTRPANLAALVFEPVGNANWSDTDDANAWLFYAPNGVIIRDQGKNCTITLDTENITEVAKTQWQAKVGASTSITITDGDVKIQAGGSSIDISNSGIDIEGALTINGQAYLDHTHSAVQTGSDDSGPVVP